MAITDMSDTRDDIEEELAAVRAALTCDVRKAVTNARTLGDWRYHFRVHPWLGCGGAAALGFALAPRRKRAPRAARAVVGDTSTAKQSVERPIEAGRPGRSFAKTFLELTAATLVEESLVYLARHGRELLDRRTASVRSSPVEVASDASTPSPTTTAENANGQSVPLESNTASAGPQAQPSPVGSLVERTISAYPKQSLLTAIAAGVLVGWITKRK